MSQPRALLALARKLLSLKAKKFEDAQVRRAVSTAYYALFQLLTDAATALIVTPGSPHAGVIRRTFNHEPMRVVSWAISDGKLPKLFGDPKAYSLSDGLKTVAKAFVDLQGERETADYDHARPFRPEKAAELVTRAEEAFAAWETVKGTDEARLYLSSFLLQKTWNQDARGTPAKRPDNTDGNPT
jgi:uncharacterized protein (UPF0332 family)